MKIVSGLLVGLFATAALAAEAAGVADGKRTVVVRAINTNGEPRVELQADEIHVSQVEATLSDTPHDGGNIVVVSTVSQEDGGADGNKSRVHVISRVARAQDVNRGWLGVALSELTDAQAVRNNIDAGVVVLNVVKDSPADLAGLQENDVIVRINGEPVEGGVPGLARTIGDLGPDVDVNLEVVRAGATIQLVAHLTAPQGGNVEWRYTPDFSAKERIFTVPHFGKLSPNGNMQFFGPDDLAELDKLPDMILELMSPMDTTTQLSFEDGKRVLKLVTNNDGDVIEVAQEGDGPIVVKRYAEGAADDAVEAEYATADDLAAQDPEAFEIYDQHRRSAVWFGAGGDTFGFMPKGRAPLSDDVRQQIEESIRSAREAMEQARGAAAGAHAAFPTPPQAFWFGDRAMRTFKVLPDGQIELTTRKGGDEIVQLYTDEADLQARNPEAYDRYADVLAAEVAE